MSEEKQFIPVIACRDNDSHWYVIPCELGAEFSRLLDGGEPTEDEFIETFSQYMTGGDVNLTQLYMMVETLEEALERDLNGDYPAGPLEDALYDPLASWQPSDARKDQTTLHSFEQTNRQALDKILTNCNPNIVEKVIIPTLPHVTDEHIKASAIDVIGKMLAGIEPSTVERVIVQNFLYKITEPPKPSALEMVEEFHTFYNVPVFKTPVFPTEVRRLLREDLMCEEWEELCQAMYKKDMVKILDGLCDLLYVVYGTAHEYGLGPILNEAITEVHRSNMSKLGADGKPVIREDGKVLKGPNFTPPDLAGILELFKDFDDKRKQAIGLGLITNPPEWGLKQWREACDNASKEGFPGKYHHLMMPYPGISAQLGVDMPNIEGLPEPTSTGVIYSDLKKEQPIDWGEENQ